MFCYTEYEINFNGKEFIYTYASKCVAHKKIGVGIGWTTHAFPLHGVRSEG